MTRPGARSTNLPIVAVVGRPNVGKSTLVNRILGRRAAVVEERPGVTRDRKEYEVEWAGRPFVLVDTGGWVVGPEEDLAADVRAQAETALAGADAVLFVVDVRTGVTEDDGGVAELLRGSEVPVLLVANKVDEERREADAADLWSLGLGTPHAVSALHGRGVGDLLEALVEVLPAPEADGPEGEGVASLAIIGRPNVGKSTLLNRLAGTERVLVSPEPGTTRDAVDVVAELDGSRYRLVDTAGIRRASRVAEPTEYYSVIRARQALEEADVALLLIDSLDGVTHQDQRLAEEAARSGAGLVVLLNKWDAIDEERRLATERSLGERLDFVGWAPVLRVSAATGARLHRLPDAVATVLENRRRRLPTGELNRLAREWQDRHPPPVRKGRRPRILYLVQPEVEPPTFVLFVGGGELGPDYLRFLENRLREADDFVGTPIRLVTRRRARRTAGV